MSDTKSTLFLGRAVDPSTGKTVREDFRLDPSDLTTHGLIVGMTGSGKTALGIVLIEELLQRGIPVLAVDPKGDLGNLLLNFPGLAPEEFAPFVEKGRELGFQHVQAGPLVRSSYHAHKQAGIESAVRESPHG